MRKKGTDPFSRFREKGSVPFFSNRELAFRAGAADEALAHQASQRSAYLLNVADRELAGEARRGVDLRWVALDAL